MYTKVKQHEDITFEKVLGTELLFSEKMSAQVIHILFIEKYVACKNY